MLYSSPTIQLRRYQHIYNFSYVCNCDACVHALIFPFIGPSALTVNIIKSITNSSIVVQWDAVDDSLSTTYTIIWTDDRDLNEVDTVDEQTSYTITGLTLDTVYTIYVTAANKCGGGPEFRTSVFFSTNTTFTTSTIVTTSMTCSTTAVTHPTTTTTAMINTTTTNSMTTVFSEDTGITTKATKNLCVTAATTTTIIKGFSILYNYMYVHVAYTNSKLIRTLHANTLSKQ